jgi:hypothetical protein
VKLHRNAALVILAGATLVALASCGKSTSITSSANAIDQAPLTAPDGVTAIYNSGLVQDVLSWNASSSPKVASYEVYEAMTNPATGGIPTRIATTTNSRIQLPEVSADCTKFYQVRSKDAQGNTSAFTTPIPVARHAQSTSNAPAGGSGSGGVSGGGGKISD